VTARHILIHTPDPVALIRRARGFVRPGGIIAFQEFDLSFCGPRFDDLPVWTTCGNAVTALFARVGLPVRAGALLYTWFLEAGLPVPECRLEFLVEGGEDSLYCEWFGRQCAVCCRKWWRWESSNRIPSTSISSQKSCGGRPSQRSARI
jgi:hypothetical protein